MTTETSAGLVRWYEAARAFNHVGRLSAWVPGSHIQRLQRSVKAQMGLMEVSAFLVDVGLGNASRAEPPQQGV